MKSNSILQYFQHEHLKGNLRDVAEGFSVFAHAIDESVPASAEKSAGLRKLLECKDCIVRASLIINKEKDKDA